MRILKVQGNGTASAEPDLVTLRFSVDHTDREYAQAVAGLNRKTAALRDGLEEVGLGREAVRTENFSVDSVTERVQERYVFAGYRAAHALQIEVPMDTQLLNRVLRSVASGRSGANISLHFSVQDRAALRRRALAAAVSAAQENATVLAAAAGIRLGDVQQIDYGWSEVRFREDDIRIACCKETEEMRGPDIMPGEVSAQESVTLVYALTA